MKQEILKFDYEGILPKPEENEDQFYEGAKQFLEENDNFKENNLEDITKITHDLNDFEERFLTRPDWISCFNCPPNEFIYKDKMNKLFTGGATGLLKGEKENFPIIYINKKTIYWNKGYLGRIMNLISSLTIEEALRHELVHSVRFRPMDINYSNENKEEEIAWSLETMKGGRFKKTIDILYGPRILLELGGLSLGIYSQDPIITPISALALISEVYNNINRKEKEKSINQTFKSLEKIKKVGNLESNPELGYGLLRMTPSDVVEFEKFSRDNSYSVDDLKKYVKGKSKEGLIYKIMAERLG